jgi:predicted NBD/HSP70 family sugar kinase
VARGSTVRDLRQGNRSRVLRSILLTGETTRARLADVCGLSPATITNVVTDLIADGLVREVGPVPSDGGRPIARLSVRPEGAYLIGADVGEHGVMVELVGFGLGTVDRVFNELPASIADVGQVGAALAEAVDTIRAVHGRLGGGPLVGMGLGLPGLIESDADGRSTFFAQSLGWPAIDPRTLCGVDDLPVYADNGARTLTKAEQWLGALRGVDHAVVALIGRGLGAGIVNEGKVLRGHRGGVGEWGHTKISVDGPRCTCGGRGCLEAYVGGGAIVARWRERGGDPGGTDEDALAGLLGAAADGDRAAAVVLDETVELLGVGLANLVNLANPRKIVIGGWAGLGVLSARGPELADAVRRHTLRPPGPDRTVEPCALGADAVALGAALLPLEELIDGNIPVHQPGLYVRRDR